MKCKQKEKIQSSQVGKLCQLKKYVNGCICTACNSKWRAAEQTAEIFVLHIAQQSGRNIYSFLFCYSMRYCYYFFFLLLSSFLRIENGRRGLAYPCRCRLEKINALRAECISLWAHPLTPAAGLSASLDSVYFRKFVAVPTIGGPASYTSRALYYASSMKAVLAASGNRMIQ